MKKLLTFALMLALVISLVGCALLPEELVSKVEDIKNSILGTEPEMPDETPDETPDDETPDEEPVHEHVFVVTKTKAATCTKPGTETSQCECGAKKEEKLPATGHDMVYKSSTEPTCVVMGSDKYSCTKCGTLDYVMTPALGHDVDLTAGEASRFLPCKREGCGGSAMYVSTDGKYADVLVFTFGEDDKTALAEKHEEMLAVLTAADKYDPALHGYAESGELYDAYEAAYAIYEAYTNLIYDAQGQYQLAQTLYYCDVANEDLKAIFDEMSEYYTDLVAKYFELSQPWYDSMYRDFFFYGATEEEINSFLFEYNTLANPEYTALKNRNDEIESQLISIRESSSDGKVATGTIAGLYEEFAANNNAMAQMMGYENYLEYAYENVYGRDYSYQDVKAYASLVKRYLVSLYNDTYAAYIDMYYNGGMTGGDKLEYTNAISSSFFTNANANQYFNDYIDNMEMAFTSNPDKTYSFSDELNNLVLNGNLFRGTYAGAYVTYIYANDLPIAYFGDGYDSASTLAHEFGHYMNEIYNNSEYDQSYDLLEMHSQGQELLYLYFLQDCISEKAFAFTELEMVLNNLYIIVLGLQVDLFEQAIYLNYYEGTNASSIMADGKITADEYQRLFESIGTDLGIDSQYAANDYWRYGMTILSPCYYVSYSVSATSSLQLYAVAQNEGFDAAKESYLKLITYTDVNPDMTMEEVLEYAELDSYLDEALYLNLMVYFSKVN